MWQITNTGYSVILLRTRHPETQRDLELVPRGPLARLPDRELGEVVLQGLPHVVGAPTVGVPDVRLVTLGSK